MNNKGVVLFCLLLSCSSFAQLQSPVFKELKAVAEPVTYRYLFWTVYSAQLFAPDAAYNNAKPMALKLSYKMDLEGKAIAERSIAEMKKQGLADPEKEKRWLMALTKIIPNVGEGDEIVGHVDERGKSSFFFNGRQIGEVDDNEFSTRFFNIWLGDKTSEPRLRLALLGKNKES